jgi:hypothetical protein
MNHARVEESEASSQQQPQQTESESPAESESTVQNQQQQQALTDEAAAPSQDEQQESATLQRGNTWRESAGRQDGPDTYQFGDLTRSLTRNAEDWASRPKQREGYEFGDLFLKRVVKSVSGMIRGSGGGGDADSAGGAPDAAEQNPAADAVDNDGDGQADPAAVQAAELHEQRLRAQAIFERHIPLLEARKQALEARAQSIEDADEQAALFRLRGTVGRSPVVTYKMALQDLKDSYGIIPTIDANFVRGAASSGGEQLRTVERCLKGIMRKAEDCKRCSQDVGADTETAS